MGLKSHMIVWLLAITTVGSVKARAEAGEVLFGAAAITAAVTPMVVTGIQAQSQTNIAQIQANTSTAISAMNAQTALYQARVNANVALAQAAVSRDIAMISQQAQTNNLLSQLQFLAYNRALDNQLARERMRTEVELQSRLLSLESKKLELARELALTNRQSGSAILSSATPNLNSLVQSVSNPIASGLGSIGSSSKKTSPSLEASKTSPGLQRVLNSSVSSGSTRSQRRAFQSDLSEFSASSIKNSEPFLPLAPLENQPLASRRGRARTSHTRN